MLQVKMYPARNGDAFLIRADGKNVLVDCGFATTFRQHIAHDLRGLSRAGERLDLLIATHIDADHILGLIALLDENGQPDARNIIKIDEIWHNSLRSLAAQSHEHITSSEKTLLESFVRRGYPATMELTANEISAKQGSSLAAAIHRNEYRWNGGDGRQSVSRGGVSLRFDGGGTVQVIGPHPQRLTALSNWWIAELRKHGYSGPTGSGDLLDDAFELVCARAPAAQSLRPISISSGESRRLADVYEADTSVTNGSSIATIIEMSGVRMLFLGDAWAEDVVEELERLRSDGQSLLFDAVKISHHGSLRNTSPALLDLIDSPTYFISSSGALHDHPDFEVLTAIVDRPAAFERNLYFNYQTKASVRLRAYPSPANAKFVVHEDATSWIEVQPTQA